MHFYVGLTPFIMLLYIVISQRFSFYTFTFPSVACCHPFLITWWSVLRFLSLHVILLIVSCFGKLHVICQWLKESNDGSRRGDPKLNCIFSMLPLLVCLSVAYIDT